MEPAMPSFQDDAAADKCGGAGDMRNPPGRHSNPSEDFARQESLFRRLVENIGTAIFVYQDPKLVYVNPVCEKMLGYTEQELLSMNFWDFVHPDFRSLVKERGPARLAGADVQQRYQLKLVRKDGVERWMDFTGGLGEYHGKPAVIGVAYDITDLKHAEQMLDDKRRELERSIVERTRLLNAVNAFAVNLADIHSMADLCRVVGESIRDMTGAAAVFVSVYDRELCRIITKYIAAPGEIAKRAIRILGDEKLRQGFVLAPAFMKRIEGAGAVKITEWREFMFDDVPDAVAAEVGAVFGGGDVYGIALRDGLGILGTLGIVMPPQASSLPLDVLDTVAGLVASASRHRLAADAVAEGEEKFWTFVANSAYAYFELTLDGRITFVNRRGEKLFDIQMTNPTPKNFIDFVVPEDRQRALDDFAAVLTSPAGGPHEYSFSGLCGAPPMRLEVNVLPLRKNGVHVGFEVTALDVTDRHRFIEKILRSEAELRRRNEYNRLRADMWKLAADKSLSEVDLIQRVLDAVGGALDVSRACFNEMLGGEVRCTLEWRAPDVRPSIGYTLPAAVVRLFENAASTRLNVLNALEFIPAEMHEAVKPVIEEMIEELDIDYVVALPWRVDGRTEGTITIDVCKSHPGRPEWSDAARTVLEDAVQIISGAIARKRMERAVEKARDDLERRVDERTRELSALNRRLEQEIAERRRAEDALRLSESLYRALVETSPDAITLTDMNARVIMANRRAAELYGCASQDEFIGTSAFDYIAPADRERANSYAEKTLRDGRIENIEYKILRKDGAVYDGELSVSVYLGADGKPAGFVGVLRDITGRKVAEQSLRENEQRLRLLAENAVDIIWSMDLDGRITFTTPAVERILGYTVEEAMKIPVFERVTPKAADSIRQAIREELSLEDDEHVAPHRSRTLEIEQYHKDGHIVWTEITASFIRDESGRPVGIVGVTRDISDRKRMEQELLNARKLEAIGILAGGVAHDFNNIITAILGNISLARRRATDENVASGLELAENAAVQARNLTQRLLAFSRGGVPVKETADLAEIISDTVRLVLSGSSVRADLSISSDLWPADVDKTQIGQVINNIGKCPVKHRVEKLETGTGIEQGEERRYFSGRNGRCDGRRR